MPPRYDVCERDGRLIPVKRPLPACFFTCGTSAEADPPEAGETMVQHDESLNGTQWKAVARAVINEVKSCPERYQEAQKWFQETATPLPEVGHTPLYFLLVKIRHWTDERYRPDLDPIAENARKRAEQESRRIIYVAWLLADIEAPDVTPGLLPWPEWKWPERTGDTRWRLAEDEPSSGWTELVAEAMALIDVSGSLHQGTSSAAPQQIADADDPGQVFALTASHRIALCALAKFDPAILASASKIAEKIDPMERLSERTITKSIKRLIELGLAERPEGDRQGARLTMEGRRLVPKIAD